VEPRSFIPKDTDPEAYDVQIRAYRRMGGIGRTAVMFRLTENGEEGRGRRDTGAPP